MGISVIILAKHETGSPPEPHKTNPFGASLTSFPSPINGRGAWGEGGFGDNEKNCGKFDDIDWMPDQVPSPLPQDFAGMTIAGLRGLSNMKIWEMIIHAKHKAALRRKPHKTNPFEIVPHALNFSRDGNYGRTPAAHKTRLDAGSSPA